MQIEAERLSWLPLQDAQEELDNFAQKYGYEELSDAEYKEVKYKR